MALSSVSISIANNPYNGYVEIHSEKIGTASSSINYILIYRKKHGIQNNYTRIIERSITDTSQLTFDDIDITACSGTIYDYYIELTVSNSQGTDRGIIEYGGIENIDSWFDGIFIGDYNEQFMSRLNNSLTTTRNTQSSYVTTLASRTPYRISNANVNYTTGQLKGLFMRIDNMNQPVQEVTKDYLESVVDYLSNGNEKILKTSDGQIWYVTVDQNISISFDDYYVGSSSISFSWTEIGDVPILKVVANT